MKTSRFHFIHFTFNGIKCALSYMKVVFSVMEGVFLLGGAKETLFQGSNLFLLFANGLFNPLFFTMQPIVAHHPFEQQQHPEFTQHFRQLLHIAFKLAAKEGARYTDLLKANSEVVGKNVTENLYDRHFKRLFVA